MPSKTKKKPATKKKTAQKKRTRVATDGSGDVFHEIGPMHKAFYADWDWYEQELRAGRLDKYMNRFVAIVESKVVDTGLDAFELSTRVSEALGVHRNRVVTAYVGYDAPWIID